MRVNFREGLPVKPKELYQMLENDVRKNLGDLKSAFLEKYNGTEVTVLNDDPLYNKPSGTRRSMVDCLKQVGTRMRKHQAICTRRLIAEHWELCLTLICSIGLKHTWQQPRKIQQKDS